MFFRFRYSFKTTISSKNEESNARRIFAQGSPYTLAKGRQKKRDEGSGDSAKRIATIRAKGRVHFERRRDPRKPTLRDRRKSSSNYAERDYAVRRGDKEAVGPASARWRSPAGCVTFSHQGRNFLVPLKRYKLIIRVRASAPDQEERSQRDYSHREFCGRAGFF